MVSSSYFFSVAEKSQSLMGVPQQETQSGQEQQEQPVYSPQTYEEQAIINVVKDFSPAVVNIIISKDLPVYEQYFLSPLDNPFFQIPQYRQTGVEKQQIGGGSGFVISEDGLVVTNKHVVLDEAAEYTILASDGKTYPADVLARDPDQDIAILKINQEGAENPVSFTKVKLGDSDTIQRGQMVVAIGYVLAKYQNTVSVGVVSGLGRTITASGGGFYETLDDVIQTDAAINGGNSGGPLLNLKGEVIGINTAVDVQGQAIGFAIPINQAKKDIEEVKQTGKITYPFLGVRYVSINQQIQADNNLPVDYGVWIQKGSQGEAAIFPGSPAEKAGLQEGDIILEFGGEKITADNTLANIILKHHPGDEVSLKVLRNGQEFTINVVLSERSS
jgi:serine protease Do